MHSRPKTAACFSYAPKGSVRFWMWILILLAVTGPVAHEMHTSTLQARILTRYSSKLVYDVDPGPAKVIVFPKNGPFDVRRGYTRLLDDRTIEVLQTNLIGTTTIQWQVKDDQLISTRNGTSGGKPIKTVQYYERVK